MRDEPFDMTTKVFPYHFNARYLVFVTQFCGFTFRVMPDNRVSANFTYQFVVSLITGLFPVALQ